MKVIRLYYNAGCDRCRRLTQLDRMLDWRRRLDISTAVPKGGPLRIGEIAVEVLATGQEFRGVQAFEQLSRHLPVYGLLRPLLHFRWFRAYVERSTTGCDGEACKA